MGWTGRRIERLFDHGALRHETIEKYYQNDCKKIDTGELTIEPLAQAEPETLIFVGGTSDLEAVHSQENQRLTGGGRKILSHIYEEQER